MDPKPKELTPEERLFKLIQEGEKSDAVHETLVVSSGAEAAVSAYPSDLETKARGLAVGNFRQQEPAPSSGRGEHEIRLKKAARAINTHNTHAGFFQKISIKNFFSLKTVTQVLAVVLIGLLAHLGISQFFMGGTSAASFMKKASTTGEPVLQVPQNLFSVNVDKEPLGKRDLFQPWHPPEVTAPTAAKVEAVLSSPSLSAALSNLRLSGIFIGDKAEALVEAVDEKRTYPVKEGSVIKGLTIKSIQPDKIVFTDGHAEQALQ